MGWYITCDICGREGKYGFDCNCHAKKSKENANKMVGSKILDSFLSNDEYETHLIQKLEDKLGNSLYMCILINDLSGYFGGTGIKEITKREYESMKN